MSPARLFLGRRLKSILPTTVLLLKSCVEDNTLVKTKCWQEKTKQKQNLDRHGNKKQTSRFLSSRPSNDAEPIRTMDKRTYTLQKVRMLSRAKEDATDVTASSLDHLVSEVTPSPEMMSLHLPMWHCVQIPLRAPISTTPDIQPSRRQLPLVSNHLPKNLCLFPVVAAVLSFPQDTVNELYLKGTDISSQIFVLQLKMNFN